FNVGAGTVQSQYISYGNHYWWVGSASTIPSGTHASFSTTVHCFATVSNECFLNFNTNFSQGGFTCVFSPGTTIFNGSNYTATCRVTVIGRVCTDFFGAVANVTGGNITIVSHNGCSGSSYYLMPNPCYNSNLAGQARTFADQNAHDYLISHGLPN